MTLPEILARIDAQAAHRPAGCLITLSRSEWEAVRAALAAAELQRGAGSEPAPTSQTTESPT